MQLLEVKNLSKTYGQGEAAVHALRGATFTVPKGEFVAVVGESGSGKSTLLNLVGGLDTPTEGKVLIDGKDIFAMKDRSLTVFRRRNIGFVFQSFNLITLDRVLEHPVPRAAGLPDPRPCLSRRAAGGAGADRAAAPSAGSALGRQQQRAAIGRALITRPALILADEPTGNLDTRNSGEVIALLKKASRTYEQTIVMITHSRTIAQTADRILQVSDGVVTDFGRCRA